MAGRINPAFILATGIVLTVVLIAAFAQVPYYNDTTTNGFSIQKVSINYFNQGQGLTALPAKPSSNAGIMGTLYSVFPFSWFNSQASAAINLTHNGGDSPFYTLEGISGSYYPLGVSAYYDGYYYAFTSPSGTNFYYTSVPVASVGGEWSQSSGANEGPYQAQAIGPAVQNGNQFSFVALDGGAIDIYSCTLTSGGSASSWNSYQVVSGMPNFQPSALLNPGGGSTWYVAMPEEGVWKSTSGLGGPWSKMNLGVTISGDIMGMAALANGDIALVYLYSGIDLIYYSPSTGSWSSSYNIPTVSGYSFLDWGGAPGTGSYQYDEGPMGFEVAAVNNTIAIVGTWSTASSSSAQGKYLIDVYNFTVGTSSAWSAPYTLYTTGSNTVWIAVPQITAHGNDFFVILNYIHSLGSSGTETIYAGPATDTASWGVAGSYTTASSEVTDYSSNNGVYGDPGAITISGNQITYLFDDMDGYVPLQFLAFIPPSSLSEFQIGVSGISASGQYVKATNSAAINTANIQLQIWSGPNPSSLSMVSSTSWNDVSLPYSLSSYTTPWLNFVSASQSGNYNYTYQIRLVETGINVITGAEINATATLNLQSQLYWSSALGVFGKEATFSVIGGNMVPSFSLPMFAIYMLLLLWAGLAIVIWHDRRDED